MGRLAILLIIIYSFANNQPSHHPYTSCIVVIILTIQTYINLSI
jgi:hypothetical protein